MIYLASRSPRRRELLQQIGVPYQIVLFREAPRRGADVDETPHIGEAPHDYVSRMALEKATAAADMIRARRTRNANSSANATNAASVKTMSVLKA